MPAIKKTSFKSGHYTAGVGKGSKTRDPKCSQAMSDWKSSGTLTHEVAVILSRCRNQAKELRTGQKVSPIQQKQYVNKLKTRTSGKKIHIDRAAKYLNDQGIQVQTVGSVKIKKWFGAESPEGAAIAVYDPATKKIHINEESDHWHDPKKHMGDQGMGDSQWFSTSNPMHVTIHESGHFFHHKNIGDKGFASMQKGKVGSEDDKALIHKEVSGYATTNPTEFVAEMYAGKKTGKKYSPRLEEMYKRFKGPEV